MSLILQIDTALPIANVGIGENGILLSSRVSSTQQDHARFLHIAIQEMLNELEMDSGQLDAVAVSSGPGSFTGLRVGMAAAKGFCFALAKPLITINTLEILAAQSLLTIPESERHLYYYIPLIDARRMEVYAAVYDHELNPVKPPHPLILDKHSFLGYEKGVLFSGTGVAKWEKLAGLRAEFIYNNETDTRLAFCSLAEQRYTLQSFANLLYAEPQYLKNNYPLPQKSKN